MSESEKKESQEQEKEDPMVVHLTRELQDIEGKLATRVASEEQIAEQRRRLAIWDRVAKEKFPDEYGSEMTFTLFHRRANFDFDALAQEARSRFVTSSEKKPEELPPRTSGFEGGSRDQEPPEQPKEKKTSKPKEYQPEIQELLSEATALGAGPYDLKRAGANEKRLRKLIDKLGRKKKEAEVKPETLGENQGLPAEALPPLEPESKPAEEEKPGPPVSQLPAAPKELEPVVAKEPVIAPEKPRILKKYMVEGRPQSEKRPEPKIKVEIQKTPQEPRGRVKVGELFKELNQLSKITGRLPTVEEKNLFYQKRKILADEFNLRMKRARDKEYQEIAKSSLAEVFQLTKRFEKFFAESTTEAEKFKKRKYLDLNQLAGDITYHFLDDLAKLKPQEGQRPDERFLEVAREVWRDIVYGAKFGADGKPLPLEQQDMDVRVSLFLFKKAGFKEENILAAEPARPGEFIPGKFNIDRGGRVGTGIEPKLTVPVQEKYGTYERPTMFADNHPYWRPRRRGSAAHGLYELLREAGFLNELAQEERRALEMMVQYSIDSDNASFQESTKVREPEGFERSDKTLRGLAYYMKIEAIYDYFLNYQYGQKEFLDAYKDAVAMHEFTPQEIKKYNLKTPLKSRHQTIAQAKERFSKSPEVLFEEGTIAQTRLGTYVVDFVERSQDKLLGGHEAVKAYGYDGYIVYDLRDRSFLVNTFLPKLDLSKDERLQKLAKEANAVTVRGVMILVPGQTSSKIKFRDILEAVGLVGEPKGKIKEALLKPIPKAEPQPEPSLPLVKGQKGPEEPPLKAAKEPVVAKSREEEEKEKIAQGWRRFPKGGWFKVVPKGGQGSRISPKGGEEIPETAPPLSEREKALLELEQELRGELSDLPPDDREKTIKELIEMILKRIEEKNE